MTKLVDKIHEAKEDELDYRVADAAWQRHLKLKTKLYIPEEAKRELGLQVRGGSSLRPA